MMTEPLESLQRDITALEEQAAHRFDPVKFRYIQSLVKRATAQNNAVAKSLAVKASISLAHYRQKYEGAQHNSELILERIEADFPDDLNYAKALHQQGRFARLKKHLAALQSDSDAAIDLGALSTLLNQSTAGHDDLDGSPLEHRMRLQEAELVSALGRQGAFEQGPSVARKEELKSAQRFRNKQAKLNADRVVIQAVEEISKDSGPLNSQRLAARSLAAMRDLSPYYLSRFVTYMDTLFWLEQADKKKIR